jgi:hypothetical protein
MTILYTLLAVYAVGGLVVMGLFIEWSNRRDDQPGKLAVVISSVIVFLTWPALLISVAKHALRGFRGHS